MSANPFVYSYFIPVLWRLGVLLCPVVGGLVSAHYLRVRRSEPTVLLGKAITVIWLAPLLVGVAFIGGFALFIVVAGVLGQSIREYSRLVMIPRTYTLLLQLYSFGGLFMAAAGNHAAVLEYPLGLVPVAFAVTIASQRVDRGYECIAAVTLGYLYISFPISLILFIRNAVPWGLQFLVIVGFATATADACAFIIGSKFGGPKLAPVISPMKTWSGALGALLGSAVGVILAWVAAPYSWHVTVALLIIVCIGVSATFGDLSESVIKRSFGRKDAGAVLAGFGGVLDRFDSFLFTIPVTFIILSQGLHLHG